MRWGAARQEQRHNRPRPPPSAMLPGFRSTLVDLDVGRPRKPAKRRSKWKRSSRSLKRLAGARSHGGRSFSVDEGRYFPESGSVITLMAIGGRARDRQTAAVEGNRRELGTFKTEVIMLQLTHKRASADGVSLPYVTVGSDPAVLCLRGWPRTNASFCRCSAAARTAIGSSR